jgi:hypothetical protein
MHSIDRAQRGQAYGHSRLDLPSDSYLTDGETLFRVERTLLDGPRDELFVELEDCATLELIFCSAQSIAELALRPVTPQLRCAA